MKLFASLLVFLRAEVLPAIEKGWNASIPQLLAIKATVTDPVFLLLSGTSVGFIQVFQRRSELTTDLIFVVVSLLIIMSILGVINHAKEGTANPKQFLYRTTIQLAVAFSVIMLGYITAIVSEVIIKLAQDIFPSIQLPAGVPTYWIFAGYAVVITYHMLKSAQLVNELIPRYLPSWFTAAFRNFSKSGKMSDLLQNNSSENNDSNEDK